MKKEKLVVLIVDDNIHFVERMAGMLRKLENIACINVASNYEEARILLDEQRPDFVLLDINMPGKNGIELLKRIKESGWDCEVIMISNHTDEFYRQQCRELGAKHFLDKSNDFWMVPDIIAGFSLN